MKKLRSFGKNLGRINKFRRYKSKWWMIYWVIQTSNFVLELHILELKGVFVNVTGNHKKRHLLSHYNQFWEKASFIKWKPINPRNNGVVNKGRDTSERGCIFSSKNETSDITQATPLRVFCVEDTYFLNSTVLFFTIYKIMANLFNKRKAILFFTFEPDM
jgi:hypothetical protein